jgi:predicted small metal-binding protein
VWFSWIYIIDILPVIHKTSPMKCGFEVKDGNQDELMKIVVMDANNTYGIKDVPPELAAKIKKTIKKRFLSASPGPPIKPY